MFAYYAHWIPQFLERIQLLNLAVKSNKFPLSETAVQTFDSLKKILLQCCLSYIRDDISFQVDCDASEHTIAAMLSQGERPVAFSQEPYLRVRNLILSSKKKLLL